VAPTSPSTDPADDDRRRSELAEFLRHRRAGLEPETVGLPVRSRRRTPGLRREDVAERAGVSVAWYTSLEQGRQVNPSRRVVEALAEALQLTAVDRDYLYGLAGHSPPTTAGRTRPDPALLQLLVDHLDVPAYCTDAHTTVVAWNPAAAVVFGDYGSWPEERRNLLWLLFREPEFARYLVDRDDYAARVVRAFRGRSDAHLKDPRAIALVESLRLTSPTFGELWDGHGVRRADSDSLAVAHPAGRITLTLVNLQGVATPGTRLSAYVPADALSAAVLETLRLPAAAARRAAARRGRGVPASPATAARRGG
jgi:transcriptional regulator with XRE-family HTH domain